MISVDDEADIERCEFVVDRIRREARKQIERAIMADPGLSIQVKLIIKQIIDKVCHA